MSTATELAAGLLWLATIAMMIVKAPHSVMMFYRVQAFADALLTALVAVRDHLPVLWVFVGLAVAVRIIVIPEIVSRGLSTPRDYSAKAPLGMGALVLYALLLTAGGMLVGRIGPDPILLGLIFGAMFVSFVHLSARYEVWSMLWALLSLDTVVDAGLSIFARTMPEETALGIYAMSLSLAIVLAFVAQRVQHLKKSLDVRELEELTG